MPVWVKQDKRVESVFENVADRGSIPLRSISKLNRNKIMCDLIKNFGIVPKDMYKTLIHGNYDFVYLDECIVLNCIKPEIERYTKYCGECSYIWVETSEHTFTVEHWSCESPGKQFKLEKVAKYPIEELFSMFPSLKCLRDTKKLTSEQNALLLASIENNRTGSSRYAARSKFNFSYYGKFYCVHN